MLRPIWHQLPSPNLPDNWGQQFIKKQGVEANFTLAFAYWSGARMDLSDLSSTDFWKKIPHKKSAKNRKIHKG